MKNLKRHRPDLLIVLALLLGLGVVFTSYGAVSDNALPKNVYVLAKLR
jgi:hypothetical protein